MDHSLGIACIGYGSLRMLRTHRFALAPAQSPARLILAEPDPVGFCVEAMSRDHPEWVERIDQDTRTWTVLSTRPLPILISAIPRRGREPGF